MLEEEKEKEEEFSHGFEFDIQFKTVSYVNGPDLKSRWKMKKSGKCWSRLAVINLLEPSVNCV